MSFALPPSPRQGDLPPAGRPPAPATGSPTSGAPDLCGCATPYVEDDCHCPPGRAAEPTAAPPLGGLKRRPPSEPTAAPPAAWATFEEDDDAMDVDDSSCDACPSRAAWFCFDVCADPHCARCAIWRHRPRPTGRGGGALYSRCEVRRHCTCESCWLVVGDGVYDATAFLPRHPAGKTSIVRNSGGRDCTEDLGFHSARAQKLWRQHLIGHLEPCGSEAKRADREGPGCAMM